MGAHLHEHGSLSLSVVAFSCVALFNSCFAQAQADEPKKAAQARQPEEACFSGVKSTDAAGIPIVLSTKQLTASNPSGVAETAGSLATGGSYRRTGGGLELLISLVRSPVAVAASGHP